MSEARGELVPENQLGGADEHHERAKRQQEQRQQDLERRRVALRPPREQGGDERRDEGRRAEIEDCADRHRRQEAPRQEEGRLAVEGRESEPRERVEREERKQDLPQDHQAGREQNRVDRAQEPVHASASIVPRLRDRSCAMIYEPTRRRKSCSNPHAACAASSSSPLLRDRVRAGACGPRRGKSR
jgi:hypothetical protein